MEEACTVNRSSFFIFVHYLATNSKMKDRKTIKFRKKTVRENNVMY